MAKALQFLLILGLIFVNLPRTKGIYVSPTAPYERGSLKIQSFSIYAGESGLAEDVEVYSPSEPGDYAVIIFLGGLDGDALVSAYSDVLTMVASHGFVVVGVTTFFTIPSDSIAAELGRVTEWMHQRLNQQLTKKIAPGITGDVANHMAYMGHSAGCKIIVKLIYSGCTYAKGLILLDPVDGYDPWGIIPDYVITPGQMVNFTMPAYILSAGLETVPSGLFPACAPAGRNAPRFYNAFNCPKWMINATDFGHMDFIDPIWWDTLQYIGLCTATSKVNELSLYRRFVGGAASAFAIGVLQGNCTAYKALEDRQAIPLKSIDIDHDLGCSANTNPPYCPQGACTII